MLVIRFNRVGRKNYAQYRLVVQENTQAPGGKHLAVVGSYNPHTKEAVLKEQEIKQYISHGAQPSDSVYNLLVREGVIDGEKRFIKVPDKKEEEQTEGEDATTQENADTKEEVKEEVKDVQKEQEQEKEQEKEEVKEDTKEEVSDDQKEQEKEETKEEEKDDSQKTQTDSAPAAASK